MTKQTTDTIIQKMPLPYAKLKALRNNKGIIEGFEILDVNPKFEQIVNRTKDELENIQLITILKDYNLNIQRWMAFFKAVITSSDESKSTMTDDNDKNHFNVTAVKYDQDILLIFIQDITVHMKNIALQNALSKEQATLRAALDAIPDFIAIKDTNGKYTMTNQTVDDHYKDRFDTVEGKTVEDVYPEKEVELVKALDQEAIKAGKSIRKKVNVYTDNGHIVTDIIRAPVFNHENHIIGLISIGRNLSETERIRQELDEKHKTLQELYEQLQHTAMHDHLTAIGNRRKFFSHITALDKPTYQLISIDLNGFKAVNDELGHHTGDDVLKVFAKDLKKLSEQHEGEAYRVGGDEFILIIPKVASHFEFKSHVNALNATLKSFHKDLSFAYGTLSVHSSELSNESAIESALKKLDKNLYIHKDDFQQKTTQEKRQVND